MKWFLAVCILCTVALAECPIAITKSYTKGLNLNSHYGRVSPTLLIGYKNVSDKKIVGTKFSIYHIDSVGDRSKSYTSYYSDSKLKPGKHVYSEWTQYEQIEGMTYPEVHLVKAMFEDGTTWVDDGTQECVLKSQKDK